MSPMRFASVCAGICAASAAWHPLGWRAEFVSEIDAFPSAVLAHHYPQVPNRGDLNKFRDWPDAAFDVLVGGTPCQSFSVAGLRAGMEDPRGNLALVYLALADRHRPHWLVWENVPGVLQSNGGRDFGAFLGGLVKLGYGFAYRVLDAQYFGVAQRRRRVFVVGCLGGWARAAAVLLEPQSLRGDAPPSRNPRESFAAILGLDVPGGDWPHDVAGTLDAAYGDKLGLEDQHLYSQRGSRFVPAAVFDRVQITSARNGSRVEPGLPSPTMCRDSRLCVATDLAVRRITPLEAERLQGFPDGYTDIQPNGKATPDGPRYKALGNSMAVPVMRWIGERIAAADALQAVAA